MNDGQVERCHVGHNDMASLPLMMSDVPSLWDLWGDISGHFQGRISWCENFPSHEEVGLLFIDPPSRSLHRSYLAKIRIT